jgi:hypothetical protein
VLAVARALLVNSPLPPIDLGRTQWRRLRGLRSLAAQETTFIELTVNNTSKQNFGDHSATERAVFVQFYYADDKKYDIPLHKVQVREAKGTFVNIDPTANPKGHRSNIAFLPGAGETTLRLSFTGPPRFQNSTFFVGNAFKSGSTASLSSQQSVRSRLMLNAAVTATPADIKIGSYCRSLRALATASDSSHQEVCDVVNDCLIADFLRDVSNYVDGRMESRHATDPSQTLRDLMSNETITQLMKDSVNDEQLRKTVTENVVPLLAGFRCVAESKDLKPWWSPFSRKHSVCKIMRKTVTFFENQWQHVIDEEKIAACQKQIEETAKSHIKNDRKKMFLRTCGRWRAALNVIHSPENKDRYPPSPGCNNSVRVLRQAELGNGKRHEAQSILPRDRQSQRSCQGAREPP